MKRVTMKQKVQEGYEQAIQNIYVYHCLIGNDITGDTEFYRERLNFSINKAIVLADLLGIQPDLNYWPNTDRERQICKKLCKMYLNLRH